MGAASPTGALYKLASIEVEVGQAKSRVESGLMKGVVIFAAHQGGEGKYQAV